MPPKKAASTSGGASKKTEQKKKEKVIEVSFMRNDKLIIKLHHYAGFGKIRSFII